MNYKILIKNKTNSKIMGRKCGVKNCLSDSQRPADIGVTFHKIPLHSDIRPKWFQLCQVTEDRKIIYVCSRHFLRADFCNFKGKKYMLRHGVLPSVFPWNKNRTKENLLMTHENESMNNDIKVEDTNTSTPEIDDKISDEPILEKPIIPLEKPTTLETKPTESLEEPQTLGIKVEKLIDKPVEIKSEDFEGIIDDILSPAHSTTIEQKIKTVTTTTGSLTFVPNTRIEALDFQQTWSPATIIEVDYEENEVLVHFDKSNNSYDEWIGINSSSIRALSTPTTTTTESETTPAIEAEPVIMAPKKKVGQVYVEGERCLASWSDARKFPASVTKVINKETYEVLFDDGYVKVLKSHRMSKNNSKASPLFDPVKGSKQDRRNNKRKINVATLFGKKAKTSGNAHVDQDSMDDNLNIVQSPPQFDAIAADTEESVDAEEELPGWYPSWENGLPVGTPSTLTIKVNKMDVDVPSTLLDDPRLPTNWEKHLIQRSEKWMTVIEYVPEKKRFRKKSEIFSFIRDNPHLKCIPSMFDFYVNKRNRVRRNRKRPADHDAPFKPSKVHKTTLKATPQPAITKMESTIEDPPSPASENPNALKIIHLDGSFKCPIDGCGKNFRRENLAQMHVKHYHPELSKFLDSTPNVADLAYARTVGDSLDRSPGVEKITPQRAPLGRPKMATPKSIATPKACATTKAIVTPKIIQSPPPQTPAVVEHAEITKLLETDPYEGINTIESSSSEPIPSGLPANMYPDIKLKDLLTKSEPVPRTVDQNVRTLNTTAVTSRPMGLRTLLPVKKEDDFEVKAPPMSQNMHLRPLRKEVKRKRLISENSTSLTEEEIYMQEYPPQATIIEAPIEPIYELPEQNTIIIEGGEVIKIVRMRQEEIINCTCGITEEDGLMIQCELCLCWQHAYCNNIQRENEVPEKYICYICQHPARQRNSKKYMHDQDWLKLGTLPSAKYHCKDEDMQAKRSEKLKISHDLSGGLLELKDFMKSLKLKIKIAEVKNHPKLYLWSKPWEQNPLPENSDVKMNIKDEISDHLYNKSEEPESMLLSLLKGGSKDKALHEFPKLDLNTLIDNNMASMQQQIPQPEVAIESADCRIHLLDHIVHCQNLVEERLGNFEREINNLDITLLNDNDENYARIRHTTSMLLKDLNTLKELSQICTF